MFIKISTSAVVIRTYIHQPVYNICLIDLIGFVSEEWRKRRNTNPEILITWYKQTVEVTPRF